MQWYLLFNVLSGVRSIPSDLHESLRALGLSRREIHRKLVLPAALPSIVTGSVAGWGGCWNSLILSEYVVFRGHSYSVLGLGALLNQATYVSGSGSLLLLSVTTMVVVVVLINRFLWQPVYQHVNERYRLEST
jgi:NitT/TauT family transport system permease protein